MDILILQGLVKISAIIFNLLKINV